MIYYYFWRGFWLYLIDPVRFYEIVDRLEQPKAQILEFKKRA